jgi:hypothetical protein
MPPYIKRSAIEIVKILIPDLHAEPDLIPSLFIQKYWSKYETFTQENNFPPNSLRNYNGYVFEILIAITLIRSNIFPFYREAKVAFIDGATYDFLVYRQEKGPIVLSAKTSMRERWKQADVEAFLLRNVHRQAKSFVITLDEKEAVPRKRDIETKSVLAVNGYIVATTQEYDELLDRLSQLSLEEAPEIKIVDSSSIITDSSYQGLISPVPSTTNSINAPRTRKKNPKFARAKK